MNAITIKCPSCNATLEAEDGLDIFYCKYCGSKIMLEGMSKESYKAKVRVKEMSHKERLKDKELEQERYKMDYQAKEKQSDWKRWLGTLGVLVILCCGMIYMTNHMFDPQKKKHNEKVAYLQQLEVEIETSLSDGDYDTALFKANQLYCDDHWSNEETAAWDSKRKAYIDIIYERKREADINNPNNIFVPASSDSFEGRGYNEVVDQLMDAGFTNISTQESTEKASLFKKKGTVEHILIGGKTEFTNEDYFDKDTPIIIYYYAEK